MRIAMIGTGYVGLVSGACFADFGHTVCCVDKDAGKIDGLNAGLMPIWEPGLESLVKANAERGRLTFTTSLPEGVKDPRPCSSRLERRRGEAMAMLTSPLCSKRYVSSQKSSDPARLW
jgi:UDPglucose 6-dehydrogenase